MVKTLFLNFVGLFFLSGCSHYHSQIIEEQPLTEKLGQYKHIVIDASSADPSAKKFTEVFSTTLFVQLKESKLFDSITYKAEPAKNADLIIKAVILESRQPPEHDDSIFVKDNKYGFKIRYSLIPIKNKKPLASISTQSDSGNRYYSVGTTEDQYCFIRSAKELIEYFKLHR